MRTIESFDAAQCGNCDNYETCAAGALYNAVVLEPLAEGPDSPMQRTLNTIDERLFRYTVSPNATVVGEVSVKIEKFISRVNERRDDFGQLVELAITTSQSGAAALDDDPYDQVMIEHQELTTTYGIEPSRLDAVVSDIQSFNAAGECPAAA